MKTFDIHTLWENICKHEGETFFTTRNIIGFTYIVKGDYILINNDKRRRSTKENFAAALTIENPTPSKLSKAGVWAPSYVWGIITDNRLA